MTVFSHIPFFFKSSVKLPIAASVEREREKKRREKKEERELSNV
tara:strand:- start:142 stop:273 length:132 start_codon:yes stop_codon:yes gene_type:complete